MIRNFSGTVWRLSKVGLMGYTAQFTASCADFTAASLLFCNTPSDPGRNSVGARKPLSEARKGNGRLMAHHHSDASGALLHAPETKRPPFGGP
jgi:hypothetical protein